MPRTKPDADEQKPSLIDVKIEERLMEKRIVHFSTDVNDASALKAIRTLWYLDSLAPGKPVLLVINSPGGSVDSGFAIWDQIMMMNSPVCTLVQGLAASMGSILSISAKKGFRYATQNARIMIHQPLIGGVIQGQATDIEIHAKEIIKTREQLIDLYVEKTGQTRPVIEKALDRDTWMSAEEAKKFGLIDSVISSYKEIGFE